MSAPYSSEPNYVLVTEAEREELFRLRAGAEQRPGGYWERAVLARFAAGRPVDLEIVREQVLALLRTIPVGPAEQPDEPTPEREA